MKLLSLVLKNFKGIKDFTLDAQGKDVSVFGDNGVGKTTLIDGQSWLLFNKDSKGNAKFEIKTLNGDGTAKTGMDHSVEGTYQLPNGSTLTLMKVYKEIWSKKRGSATKEFTGNTTDYYVDGVPSKQKEYQEAVAKIADEEAFKLLTSPTYFPEQLHWTNRRKLLLEVCGDITDADVIASNKELADLPAILDGKSCEDMKKIIQGKRKKINEDLERIPVRIDEVERGLPELPPDSDALQKETIKLNHAVNQSETEYRRIQNGGQVAELEKKLAEADTAIINLTNQLRKNHSSKDDIVRASIDAINSFISEANNNKNNAEIMVKNHLSAIGRNEATLSQLKSQWQDIHNRTLNTTDTICPTCKREFDQNEIDAAIERFNIRKADDKAENNRQGKELTGINADLRKGIAKCEAVIASLTEGISAKQVELSNLKASLRAEPIFSTFPEIIKAEQSRDLIKDEIELLKSNNNDALMVAGAKVDKAKMELQEVKNKLKAVIDRERGEERIKELKAEEKTLAANFEELERQLHLIDLFTRTKVDLLEESINSKFKMAKFKLFDTQLNDGIRETCAVTYNGVPFETGLNTGHRILVGIDIIETLSKHFNFWPPLWVDNAESITQIPETTSQCFALIVSEKDKKLRVA